MKERSSAEIVEEILRPGAHHERASVRPQPTKLHKLLAGPKPAFVATPFPPTNEPLEISTKDSFSYQESTHGDILMIHLSGGIREPNETAKFLELCARLQQEEKQNPILINFADVTFFGADALRYMFPLHGWNIRLTNVTEPVREIFRVLPLFTICDSESEAIASLQERRTFGE